MPELTCSVDIAASVDQVWSAATDWASHDRWMLLTRARADGDGVGTRIEAFTGIGRFGFLDSMTVTEWEPPRRCAVLHTGRVVRGTAAFEVTALPDGRSRFTWTERLDLPLGAVGRLGFPLVRPVVLGLLRLSLRRLARWAAPGPGRFT